MTCNRQHAGTGALHSYQPEHGVDIHHLNSGHSIVAGNRIGREILVGKAGHSRITIAHRIGNQITTLVDKSEINTPCVDSHRAQTIGHRRPAQTLDHVGI